MDINSQGVFYTHVYTVSPTAGMGRVQSSQLAKRESRKKIVYSNLPCEKCKSFGRGQITQTGRLQFNLMLWKFHVMTHYISQTKCFLLAPSGALNMHTRQATNIYITIYKQIMENTFMILDSKLMRQISSAITEIYCGLHCLFN